MTTTISQQQFDHASRAVAEAGLSDRVTVLREDYRALIPRFRGAFDKLAAIEMVEAVGHDYLPDYLRTVSDLLAPDGLALVQAILMPDHWYEAYRRSVDFIQRHVFPGGLLPSLARMQACAAEASDLRLVDLEDLTPDYARTLAGPALMTGLILHVSGVTLLEAGLRNSKPGYRDYIERTNAFLPWRPREPRRRPDAR